MSTLDIILVSLGATAVIIYLILKILQTKRYNKLYREQIENGKTPEKARLYCDSVMEKEHKPKKAEDQDTPFEE